MNTSMMDSYNLGWKLASVLAGKASPSLLSTYEVSISCTPPISRLLTVLLLCLIGKQEERHKIAKELIERDYTLSRMFAARPKEEGGTGVRSCQHDFVYSSAD